MLGTGIEARSIPLHRCQTSRDRSPVFQRRPAAPHLAARRPPRAGGLRLDRLARGGRPDVVADAAAGPAGPPSLALQGGLRVRRLAGPAGRAAARRCRRPRSSTSASARRYWIEDWAALRPARRGRRPGPLRPRVGGAAGVRRRARRADHRRRPDLRRARAAPTTARTRSCSRPARVAGTPPDAYTDKGQLWGNPLYDWPAMQRRGYRWWTDAAAAHVRALRPRAHRPLPRLRRLLGGPGERQARAQRLAGSAGRGAPCSTPPRAALERELPLIAEDLGVITPAVERLRDGLGFPGMVVAPVRLRPRRPGQPPQPVEPRRAARRLHRHPRPRHRARLVRVDLAGAARAGGSLRSTRPACASPSRGGR